MSVSCFARKRKLLKAVSPAFHTRDELTLRLWLKFFHPNALINLVVSSWNEKRCHASDGEPLPFPGKPLPVPDIASMDTESVEILEIVDAPEVEDILEIVPILDTRDSAVVIDGTLTRYEVRIIRSDMNKKEHTKGCHTVRPNRWPALDSHQQRQHCVGHEEHGLVRSQFRLQLFTSQLHHRLLCWW